MNKSILKIINLHKYYETGKVTQKVLTGLNLDIDSGEFLGITGDSGSGKSTFLNVIATLDNITQGKIIFNSSDLSALSSNQKAVIRNKNFGFIFQFHHLLNEFTALENIIIPGLILRVDKSELIERGRELLNQVKLSDKEDSRPNQLSGGEQQRIAVARALINNPSIIFADEPTGNLDEKNSENVFELLIELNKMYNTTLILVTHNHKLAKQASRHFHLTKGNLVDMLNGG